MTEPDSGVVFVDPEGGGTGVPFVHVYTSTACLHGACETCQVDTIRYDGTYKVAAECMYCAAPCQCGCHQQGS